MMVRDAEQARPGALPNREQKMKSTAYRLLRPLWVIDGLVSSASGCGDATPDPASPPQVGNSAGVCLSIILASLTGLLASCQSTASYSGARSGTYALEFINGDVLPIVHREIWRVCRRLPGTPADTTCQSRPTGCFIVTDSGELTLGPDGMFALSVPRTNSCTEAIMQEWDLWGTYVIEPTGKIVLTGSRSVHDTVVVEGDVTREAINLYFGDYSYAFSSQ